MIGKIMLIIYLYCLAICLLPAIITVNTLADKIPSSKYDEWYITLFLYFIFDLIISLVPFGVIGAFIEIVKILSK